MSRFLAALTLGVLANRVQAQCWYTSALADGYCDSYANTAECTWDGGDCCNSTCVDGDYYACADYTYYMDCQDPDASEYVAPLYPNCYYTTSVGDGYCDSYANEPDCGWDGGDCCNSTCTDGSYYSCSDYTYSMDCQDPDASDYVAPLYPDCSYTSNVGDGYCNYYTNTPECGWDGGDCCNSTCTSAYYSCSDYTYNQDCQDPDATEYDAGAQYPDCAVYNLNYLADGFCDGYPYNVATCGYDGGDCCNDTCVAAAYSCSDDTNALCKDPDSLYFNPLGEWPLCDVPTPSYVADGYCDGWTYNVASCGYDGGDCCNDTCVDAAFTCSGSNMECSDPSSQYSDPLRAYPLCSVTYPSYVADGYCDGSTYNTAACGWDGGDCCNSTCTVSTYACTATFDCRNPLASDAFPACDVTWKSYIGDGYCDGIEYNKPSCNWDGGDCCTSTCVDSTFNCSDTDSFCLDPTGNVDFVCYADAASIGDGVCDSQGYGSPNTLACGWDNGDCCADGASSDCLNPYSANYIYSACGGAIVSYIGDGYCDGGDYNTAACGYDGGDCCSYSCEDTLLYTCGDGGFDCVDAGGSAYTTISFLYTTASPPTVPSLQAAIQSILGLETSDIVSVSIQALTANSQSSRRVLQDTVTYRVVVVVVTDGNDFFAAASKLEQMLPNELGDETATVSDGAVLDASGTVDPDGNEPPVNVGLIVGVVVAIVLIAVIVVVVVVVVNKRGKGIDTGDGQKREEAYKTDATPSAQGTASI